MPEVGSGDGAISSKIRAGLLRESRESFLRLHSDFLNSLAQGKYELIFEIEQKPYIDHPLFKFTRGFSLIFRRNSVHHKYPIFTFEP